MFLPRCRRPRSGHCVEVLAARRGRRAATRRAVAAPRTEAPSRIPRPARAGPGSSMLPRRDAAGARSCRRQRRLRPRAPGSARPAPRRAGRRGRGSPFRARSGLGATGSFPGGPDRRLADPNAASPRMARTPAARHWDAHAGLSLMRTRSGEADAASCSHPDWRPTMSKPTLEPAAQAFADATAQPPFLYELGPEGARMVLDDVQAAPIAKLDVDETWITVPAEVGDVRVRIVKPVGTTAALPVVLYVHGGGWVLGNAGTHDRLVRELAVGVNAAIVFVEYDRSPEAHYPVAIEQAYATARWIVAEGHSHDLDASRLAIAGDSVGGNMTAAVAILAKQRGDVTFVHQSMYYPVTDAAQDTDSYLEFAEGPFLLAKSMAWFWDAYCPDEERRSEITASPLRATLDELAGLPEAFVLVDENDVLRDQGEAYARKLTEAGVRTTSVRVNGILHDFMMLNPLRETAASTAAIEQAIHVLRKALDTR